MAKYIDAEKLKAEIEKSTPDELEFRAYRDFIIALIDSLQQEQPEVDLEKEIVDYWTATEWCRIITLSKFKVIARYFYGLGKNSK